MGISGLLSHDVSMIITRHGCFSLFALVDLVVLMVEECLMMMDFNKSAFFLKG